MWCGATQIESEAALSHYLRRGLTPALRGWGFNPTLGQGETAPLDPVKVLSS